MCAALSAREAGARVLVVEKAPEAWRGGNGFFTAGGFRFAFKSFEELCDLVGDLSDEEKASMEVDPYTEETFYDDLMRVTEDCADPDLAMLLVRQSQPTVRWMRDRGVRWIPMFGRQAYKVDGRFRFWGGLVLEAVGGGPGLIDMEYQAAAQAGIDVRFETKAIRLLTDDRGAVTGLAVRTPAGAEAHPGRRHPDGARDRRAPVGPLERLPRRPVGSERAVARRPEGRRQFSEAFVPTGTHREPPRRALRGRGRRLPQLHLREVRTRGDRAAAARRVSDLRREGPPPAAGGVPDPRGDEGRGPDARGPGAEARDRRRGVPAHGRGLQRRRHARRVQPGDQGRQAHARDRAAQVELGAPPRRAALRRLRGHDRHHVHVRRRPHHRRRAGRGHRAAADSRALRGRRARGRALLPQLSGWRRPHGGRRVRPDRGALGGVERRLGGGASPPLIWWGALGGAAPLHPTTNPSRTTRRTSRTRSARSSPGARRASRLPGSSPVENPSDRRSARAAPPR